MVKIKHKDFIGAVPITSCQNSSWKIGLRIYGEGRTQISEFTCYNRSFRKNPGQTGSILIFTLIQKLLTIPRLIAKWYPLLIIIMVFLLTDSLQKLKLEKIHDILIILFNVSPSSPQLQRLLLFLIKNTQKQLLFSK